MCACFGALPTRARWVEALHTYVLVLMHTRIHSCDFHFQAWVAGSIYMELKEDTEKAMEYADKALQLDSRHAEGHLRKGSLYLDRSMHELALASYRSVKRYVCGLRVIRKSLVPV